MFTVTFGFVFWTQNAETEAEDSFEEFITKTELQKTGKQVASEGSGGLAGVAGEADWKEHVTDAGTLKRSQARQGDTLESAYKNQESA